MKITTDDLLIFELLEKAGLADFDPVQPNAFWFRHEERAHLLLFQPTDPGKGCSLFTMSSEPGHKELESELLPLLIGLPERHTAECWLKAEALRITELMIMSRDYRLRFFDAH